VIFVDTSAFIALVDQGDKFNKLAIEWWKKNQGVELVTSNLVIIETLGWIRNKRGKAAALKLEAGITEVEGMSVIRVTEGDEREGREWFKKLDGRGVSMIDCTTIAVMKRQKINTIFAFDEDFEKAGFEVVPN